MKKTKVICLCTSLFFIPTNDSNAANVFSNMAKKITGNESTSDVLDQLKTLAEIKTTLNEVDELNKTIRDKEKAAAETSGRKIKELNQKIEQNNKKIENLREDVLRKAKIRIDTLEGNIKRNEGEISDLKTELNAQSNLSALTSNVAYWVPLEIVKTADIYAKSYDSSHKDHIQEQISQKKDVITKLKKTLTEAIENMADVQADTEFVAAMKKLTQEANSLSQELNELSEATNKWRKENIFDKHDNRALKIMDSLPRLIKAAKCTKIPSLSEAKIPAIDACMKDKLKTISKAEKYSNKCKNLSTSSSPTDFDKCKKDYRKQRGI